MELHFYVCDVCGKVIAILSDSGVPTVCCGQPMRELVANHTDGAFEKHVPVYRREDDTVNVKVGEKPHPMLAEHSICWIGLRTGDGFSFKARHPGDSPEACWALCRGEEPEAVYAYCDLHGLWSREVKEHEN